MQWVAWQTPPKPIHLIHAPKMHNLLIIGETLLKKCIYSGKKEKNKGLMYFVYVYHSWGIMDRYASGSWCLLKQGYLRHKMLETDVVTTLQMVWKKKGCIKLSQKNCHHSDVGIMDWRAYLRVIQKQMGRHKNAYWFMGKAWVRWKHFKYNTKYLPVAPCVFGRGGVWGLSQTNVHRVGGGPPVDVSTK